MNRQARIAEYIRLVCSQIRNREVHAAISFELESHLEDKIEEYEAQGYSEQQAIDRAIADLGDPVQVGRQLHRAHRPRMEWSVVAIVTVLIGVGLLAMYSLSSTQAAHPAGWSLFENKLLGTFAALILLPAILFLDYRKWKRYSRPLFLGTLLLMLVTLLQDYTVNGKPYLSLGAMHFDMFGASTLLLAIALTGMFSDWQKKWMVPKACALFLVPFVFYLSSHDLFAALMWFVCFSVLLLTSPAGKNAAFALIGLNVTFASLLVCLFIQPYQISRIAAFLDPHVQSDGAGYLYLQTRKIIQSAGLWGNGLGTSANSLSLPAVESDFVFTYLVHSFGLATGVAVILLGIVLFARLLKAVRRIPDRYGVMLMAGLMPLFFVPYFWSILMSLGVLPIAPVTLPFVSHGKGSFLMQILLIGLLLNVYRRKDILPWTECRR